MALINCEFVGEALIVWLEQASQNQRDELCDALGCGPTDEEIAKVFLDCDEIVHIPGNKIPTCDQMNAAIAAAIAAITFQDGTVTITGTGTAADPYVLNVKLDTTANNMITGNASTGLYVAPEIPPGGTDGQILTRNSTGGVEWRDIPIGTALFGIGDVVWGSRGKPYGGSGVGGIGQEFAGRNDNRLNTNVPGSELYPMTFVLDTHQTVDDPEIPDRDSWPIPNLTYQRTDRVPSGSWRSQGAQNTTTVNVSNFQGSACIYRRIL